MSESTIIPTIEPPCTGKYKLVNAYEDMVKTSVWELMLRDPDVCRCEKCYLDACAIVMNNSRYSYSKFVTTRSGSVLAKVPEMNHGRRTEMTVAILEALKAVKKFPMHDD